MTFILIQEICNEEKINYKFLSKDWVIMLEKNNLTKFICGYKFDLNSHGIGQIADDKYALFEVLASKIIPVTKHKIVYNPKYLITLDKFGKSGSKDDIYKEYGFDLESLEKKVEELLK